MKVYARTKKWLKGNYPLPFKCRIQIVNPSVIPECLGEFRWLNGRGLIRISKDGTEATRAETLLEEYAHALRHSLPMAVDYDGEPHDAMFWSIYGELVNCWRNQCLR